MNVENKQQNNKRRGPGRPPGSKNKKPKNTSRIEGREIDIDKKINEAVEAANKKFIKGLSGEMKKLYIGFSKRQKLPLDDLRELAQSMKARYNIALQSEIQEHEETIRLAKEEIKEIKKTNKLYGKTATKDRINNKLRSLERFIASKYHISSQLTTLSAELKNVFVEIERIEAGQPKGNVNIFNILKGKGDPEKINQLEEELFTPDEELSNQLERDKENDN